MYIPALEGYVPVEMIRVFTAFLDFCYTVRRDSIHQDHLLVVRESLTRFHHYRTIFQETGVREDGPKGLSLPRAHSADHYEHLITEFGAPNGLCSSITESKHIKAVKEPWRRSSRYKALGQMILTNQRLTKLAAAKVDFIRRGMLEGTVLSDAHDQLVDRVGVDADVNGDEQDDGGDLAAGDRDIDRNVLLRREAQADIGAYDGPRVLNNVTMAKTKRARFIHFCYPSFTD